MEKIRDILKRLDPSRKASPSHSAEPPPRAGEYKCPICRDLGYVHPLNELGIPVYYTIVPCKCRAQMMALKKKERLMKWCQLPTDTEHMTFETFKAYTQELKDALAAAKEVASPDGELKWLTIMAKVDRGKSHLAIAICREWLKRDISAKYVFVPDLLDELRAGYHMEGDDSFLSKMHFYKTVPLLAMDDLGSERPSEWVVEKLTSIINTRGENGLRLVVTTNKTLDALPGDIENRIGSRLRRHRAGKVIAIEDAGEYSLKEGKEI